MTTYRSKCSTCNAFIPDEINPVSGIGACRHGITKVRANGAWIPLMPMALHNCKRWTDLAQNPL